MTAEIISVGTELLLGNIANTTAPYLAGRMTELGFDLYCQTIVGDDAESIRKKLDDAWRSGTELVILTGVIGPEKDDALKEMLAFCFGKELEFDQDLSEKILKQARALGAAEEDTEKYRRMAVVPADSLIMANECGTAPGCVMEQDGKVAVLLPGTIRELEPMFEQCVNICLHNFADRCVVTLNIRLKTEREAPRDRVGTVSAAARLGELLELENPTVTVFGEEEGTRIRIRAAAPSKGDASLMANIIASNCIQVLGEETVREITEE